MILEKGQLSGAGKVLVDGASLGGSVEVDLQIEEDNLGFILNAAVSGELQGDLTVRIAADEVGTYRFDCRGMGLALSGRGKLESEPNLIMLWDETLRHCASIAVFSAREGIGCRGFWLEGKEARSETRTWEILFKPKHVVVGGSNVVSLRRR